MIWEDGLIMKYRFGRAYIKQELNIKQQSILLGWDDSEKILITSISRNKTWFWLRARTHGQKGTQICDPLANKCP